MQRNFATGILLLMLCLLPGTLLGAELWGLPPVNEVLIDPPGERRQISVIEQLDFVGATVPSIDALEEVRIAFLGKLASATELDALRRRVNSLYRELGMPGSGALVAQSKGSGRYELLIVEGRLGAITITGVDEMNRDFVISVLGDIRDQPLRRDQLLTRLRILDSHPAIESVLGELVPTDTLGVVDLNLKVTRSKKWAVRLAVDNSRSPSVGAEQLKLSMTGAPFKSLNGLMSINLDRNPDDGGGALGLNYEHALNGPLSGIGASFRRDDADLIEAPFADLNIESETRSVSVYGFWQQIVAPNRTRRFNISLDVQRSQSRLLGRGFSFSPGEVNGRSAVSLVSLGHQELWRGNDIVIDFQHSLGIGLGMFGATEHANLADGRFHVWRFNLSAAKALSPDIVLHPRIAGQLASDELLPIQRYALGGVQTVRGYRQNTLVRDNAIHSGVELERRVAGTDLRLSVFSDWGIGWNHDAYRDAKVLHGLGMGLHWQPLPELNVNLDIGHAMRDRRSYGNKLQDRGIHFSVQWRWR